MEERNQVPKTTRPLGGVRTETAENSFHKEKFLDPETGATENQFKRARGNYKCLRDHYYETESPKSRASNEREAKLFTCHEQCVTENNTGTDSVGL